MGVVRGSNARCIAMLSAFKKVLIAYKPITMFLIIIMRGPWPRGGWACSIRYFTIPACVSFKLHCVCIYTLASNKKTSVHIRNCSYVCEHDGELRLIDTTKKKMHRKRVQWPAVIFGSDCV